MIKILKGPDGVLTHLEEEVVILCKREGGKAAALVVYQGHFTTYWDWYNDHEVDGIKTPDAINQWLDAQLSEVTSFLFH